MTHKYTSHLSDSLLAESYQEHIGPIVAGFLAQWQVVNCQAERCPGPCRPCQAWVVAQMLAEALAVRLN